MLVLEAGPFLVPEHKAPLKNPTFDFVDLASDADFDREFGHRRAWVQFKTADGKDHTANPIWQEMHDTGHAITRALVFLNP